MVRRVTDSSQSYVPKGNYQPPSKTVQRMLGKLSEQNAKEQKFHTAEALKQVAERIKIEQGRHPHIDLSDKTVYLDPKNKSVNKIKQALEHTQFS